ncbi:MAG: c-type cytochrome [Parachlamydia sp.]|nr:c-type cytochrome [Parachlamydia sp.]
MKNTLIVFITAFLGIALFYGIKYKAREIECYDRCSFKHELVLAKAHTLYSVELMDPEQAPPAIRDSVLRGYRLVLNTGYYAPDYVKNQLSCTNCHLFAGDTLGGKNGGISLVGVTAAYPRFSKRDNKSISLEDRMDNCFMRSMNGIPLPRDSQEMKDIIAYLTWISKEVGQMKDPPWLGLKNLKSKHTPDPEKGQKLYMSYCASCHKENGEGGAVLTEIEGKSIPPLWGQQSFNDGAGMNRLGMLSSFIYWNMPFQDASLSEEEALDVASFVIKQPRPHFIKKQ